MKLYDILSMSSGTEQNARPPYPLDGLDFAILAATWSLWGGELSAGYAKKPRFDFLSYQFRDWLDAGFPMKTGLSSRDAELIIVDFEDRGCFDMPPYEFTRNRAAHVGMLSALLHEKSENQRIAYWSITAHPAIAQIYALGDDLLSETHKNDMARWRQQLSPLIEMSEAYVVPLYLSNWHHLRGTSSSKSYFERMATFYKTSTDDLDPNKPIIATISPQIYDANHYGSSRYKEEVDRGNWRFMLEVCLSLGYDGIALFRERFGVGDPRDAWDPNWHIYHETLSFKADHNL